MFGRRKGISLIAGLALALSAWAALADSLMLIGFSSDPDLAVVQICSGVVTSNDTTTSCTTTRKIPQGASVIVVAEQSGSNGITATVSDGTSNVYSVVNSQTASTNSTLTFLLASAGTAVANG